MLEALRAQALLRGSDAKASMLQDVLKHRRTEIDYLNGSVSDEGKRLGVPTPFCDAASALVRSQGVGLLEPHPDNLKRVVESMPAAEREAIAALRQSCVDVVGEQVHVSAKL
eukprot:SAG11_NODE_627_length_8087_cov_3.567852_1_plen_112_part_00